MDFPRTDEVDSIVKRAAQEWLVPTLQQPWALTAVGGYGRRELFPYSDVDVLIAVDSESAIESLKEPFSQFLRVLWDAGVKASHSVRTIAECCRLSDGNLPLSISLLDVRFVAGSAELFQTLEQYLSRFFEGNARVLLRDLGDAAAARHSKFGDTVYHLEPNIKDGPGGVRDIHLVHWAAQLAPTKEALRHAVGTIAASRDFLYRLRFFLHESAGRDNNVLTFEWQDKAAAALSSEAIPPEAWMRQFYRHARVCFGAARQTLDFIARGESGLVRQFFDRRDRLSTADYTVAHNQILLRKPAETLASQQSVFGLFRFVARTGVPLAWDTRRRLQEQASALASRDEQTAAWSEWRELLSLPHAAQALHEMAETRVLAALLPVWREVESLVVRDFYHRYTVDEHSLTAVGAIDRLIANDPESPARFRELAREESEPALLRMALLLHDLGKGTAPGDHVRGSTEAARAFLATIATPASETRGILFLIDHHLDLSLVMNGRDPDDPATARFLSSRIGTYEDLRRLTLLTYADVSAVNPTAMTPWRVEQLWKVYSVAAEQLTRELVSERIRQVSKPILLRDPDHVRFLEGFPVRYSRIHTQSEMDEHFRLEKIRRQTGVGLAIRREPGSWVMTVVAADRPGLFAALCGTLAGFGLNIVRAEAAANSDGIALDEFRFVDPNRTLELNPEEIGSLRWTTERVIDGTTPVSDVLKRRRNPSRTRSAAAGSFSFRFDNSASDYASLLYFVGEDRPGLLFELSSVLTQTDCNIEIVLVNTEGRRAHDVFYVTSNDVKLDAARESEVSAKLTRLASAGAV